MRGAHARVALLVELQGRLTLGSANLLVVRFELCIFAFTMILDGLLVGRADLHARGLLVLPRETVLAFALAILGRVLVLATSLLGGFLLRGFIDVTFAALVAASRWATNTVPIDGSSRTTFAVVPA